MLLARYDHAGCVVGAPELPVTNWGTKPESIEESRWRLPMLSEMPTGDLVAVGGDLEPSSLVSAYRRGIFPMEVSGVPGLLGWWSPDPRGILPLDRLRVTRSMRQSAKRYEVRADTCFDHVMRACADPSREDGWINEDFIRAYTRLHELGWAHSIEVFDGDGQLAGGLYGVRIDRLFAGESMFHHKRDASKIALMALVDLMGASGLQLLDVQWCTEHLASLGAIAISRHEYFARLRDVVEPDNHKIDNRKSADPPHAC
jgi:leucyl/phenylalanyl-tRNA---protein transferase